MSKNPITGIEEETSTNSTPRETQEERDQKKPLPESPTAIKPGDQVDGQKKEGIDKKQPSDTIVADDDEDQMESDEITDEEE